MKLADRLEHAWNAFMSRSPTESNGNYTPDYFSATNQARTQRFINSSRTKLSMISTRIAIDVSQTRIVHCRVDENDNFLEKIKNSPLNRCFGVSANDDQTGRAFFQDVCMSLLDEGVVAIVPAITNIDPILYGGFEISELRTGKIVGWEKDRVKVRFYNKDTGRSQECMLPKRIVAIVENPLYSVMNEQNSTLKRLVRNIGYLDRINSTNSSSKLNMIVQLPYPIRTEKRKDLANERTDDLSKQLTNSEYGVAYIDNTEKITQLNRPLGGEIQQQIKDLTAELYSELGMSEKIFDGTASEAEMLNYYNHTIEPIVSAICDEMLRKFLTKTAITQGQSIKFFRDPFKLVPVSSIAGFADTLSRNAILTSNELRGLLGFKPSTDQNADTLVNKNMPFDQTGMDQNGSPPEEEELPEDQIPQMTQEELEASGMTEDEILALSDQEYVDLINRLRSNKEE